jgi:CheY-like chemotaxis protein
MMRLFIVDDMADARALLRSVAEYLGHEVVGEAEDGESACEQVRVLHPDVVVVDWQMPGLDGVQTTIRMRSELPGLPVIGFTSAAEPEVHDAFLRAGAAACVRKGDLAGLQQAIVDVHGRWSRTVRRTPRPAPGP